MLFLDASEHGTADKSNRLKKGKLWMGCAEDVIHEMRSPENTDPEQKVTHTSKLQDSSLSAHITINRRHREHIPAAVDAAVKALISDLRITTDSGAVIYMDRLVVWGKRCV